MPDGWRSTTIGEIAEVVGGGTPKTGEPTYWGGDLVWLTPTEITKQEGQVIATSARRITRAGLDASSATLLPKDAVLVTSRATIGATALAGCDLATNQGFASLVANRDLILPRFLLLWVQAHRREFEARASGSTFPEISRSKVRAIPVVIPGLAEQRRIVDLIGALDAQIAALGGEEASASVLASAALEQLVRLSMQSGVMARLDELLAAPATYGVLKPGDEDPQGVPLIRGQDIQGGGVARHQVRTITPALDHEYRRSRVATGDVILVLVGVPGTCGLVPPSLDGANISRAVGRLRCGERILPRYLFGVLTSPWGQSLLKDEVRGAVQQMINLKELRALQVPVPLPDVQAELAENALAPSSLVAYIQGEMRDLRALRSALLTDLMSAKVDIPDAYDALLRRAV